jgi:hypothetical protein
MERRILQIGTGLVLCGSLLVSLAWSMHQGFSLAAGGVLAAGNLAWLRSTVGGIMFENAGRSRRFVLVSFLLRLLLIPLCLYAMIRFLFLGPVAIVAGFALFYLAVPVEGLLEAIGSKPE